MQILKLQDILQFSQIFFGKVAKNCIVILVAIMNAWMKMPPPVLIPYLTSDSNKGFVHPVIFHLNKRSALS